MWIVMQEHHFASTVDDTTGMEAAQLDDGIADTFAQSFRGFINATVMMRMRLAMTGPYLSPMALDQPVMHVCVTGA